MVFSQTSHKAHSILKVVDVNHLMAEKNQQVTGSIGVITDRDKEARPLSPPLPTTSFSEGYLKQEPLYNSTMSYEADCEFFQDLVPWLHAPAKEERVQTIDSLLNTEERAHNIDSLHTQFSPLGWDTNGANSPQFKTSFYNYNTPIIPESPNMDVITQYDGLYKPEVENKTETVFQEQFLDINSLPVVIGDLASERVLETSLWPATKPLMWADTHDPYYTKTHVTPTETTSITQHTMPFNDQEEDSLDLKFVSVIPREVESNDVVVSEYIINKDVGRTDNLLEIAATTGRAGLSVDVDASAPVWPQETQDLISTPDVLSFVEQLEKEKYTYLESKPPPIVLEESCDIIPTDLAPTAVPLEYDLPITPKSESHLDSDEDSNLTHSSKRKYNDSEDSDETYTPYDEQFANKAKKRKSTVPIKDMIRALEGSQQLLPKRRGRPPKRRESNVSSVCSFDENSSIPTQEKKYRELREKNNEASKRSRMNRKLKELQMELLATDLEESNRKLRVRADILEEMTKRLKKALMTAILQK